MDWISTSDKLPPDLEKVIILRDNLNIQAAILYKGKTREQVEMTGSFGFADQHDNNLVPYAWRADGGPMTWYGQEVTHWMTLPRLPEMNINTYKPELISELEAMKIEEIPIEDAKLFSCSQCGVIRDLEVWETLRQGKHYHCPECGHKGYCLMTVRENAESTVRDESDFALDLNELDLIRQWYNAIKDTNPEYLEEKDHSLMNMINDYVHFISK